MGEKRGTMKYECEDLHSVISSSFFPSCIPFHIVSFRVLRTDLPSIHLSIPPFLSFPFSYYDIFAPPWSCA